MPLTGSKFGLTRGVLGFCLQRATVPYSYRSTALQAEHAKSRVLKSSNACSGKYFPRQRSEKVSEENAFVDESSEEASNDLRKVESIACFAEAASDGTRDVGIRCCVNFPDKKGSKMAS